MLYKDILLRIQERYWKSYDLFGKEVCVSTGVYQNPKIISCDEPVPEPVNCDDTDGGKDYYEYGIVKGCVSTPHGGGCGTTWDKCVDEKTLDEAYCNADGSAGHIKYSCPGGCKDGACMQEEECEKVCKYIGTRSEGWYDSCTGELIKYDNCGQDIPGPDEPVPEEPEPWEPEPEEPVPTCYDGIWNDGETGVDCGGPCKPCGTAVLCTTGCIKSDKCLPFGTRIVEGELAFYCDINSQFTQQKVEKIECQNDYECETNTCSSGKCIDLTGKLEEQQNLLEKILNWFAKIFGRK